MRAKTFVIPMVFVAAAGLTAAAGSVAVGRVAPAPTTVTIKAEGTDLSGTVSSPKPVRCADGRTVLLIKQIGTRGGGDDIRFGMDTAGLQGDVYTWSTGTTGTAGRFYARVKPIEGCKGDTSPTVRAQR
ncbi:MAG TPA: hypothetical protein VLK34_06460 [Nocardioidaceae bacterium]|nr:hypothetical protein [Nocardioidaceae bacterium]